MTVSTGWRKRQKKLLIAASFKKHSRVLVKCAALPGLYLQVYVALTTEREIITINSAILESQIIL